MAKNDAPAAVAETAAEETKPLAPVAPAAPVIGGAKNDAPAAAVAEVADPEKADGPGTYHVTTYSKHGYVTPEITGEFASRRDAWQQFCAANNQQESFVEMKITKLA